jgi:glutathione peroxidase
MKNLILIATLFMLQSFTPPPSNSIHKFTIKSIDGGVIDFSKFKGKKILVVNTASECG